MNDLQFSTAVLARIRNRDARYDERAYLFLLAAIEFLQCRQVTRRHVSGAELAWACRDFAVQRFGRLAELVLEYWGVRRTEDFGRIVFILVDVGLLMTQPTDREEDFAGIYQFAEAFNQPYEWDGVSRA